MRASNYMAVNSFKLDPAVRSFRPLRSSILRLRCWLDFERLECFCVFDTATGLTVDSFCASVVERPERVNTIGTGSRAYR